MHVMGPTVITFFLLGFLIRVFGYWVLFRWVITSSLWVTTSIWRLWGNTLWENNLNLRIDTLVFTSV